MIFFFCLGCTRVYNTQYIVRRYIPLRSFTFFPLINPFDGIKMMELARRYYYFFFFVLLLIVSSHRRKVIFNVILGSISPVQRRRKTFFTADLTPWKSCFPIIFYEKKIGNKKRHRSSRTEARTTDCGVQEMYLKLELRRNKNDNANRDMIGTLYCVL